MEAHRPAFTSAGLGVSPPLGPGPVGPGPICAGTGPAAPIALPRPPASPPPAVPSAHRTPSAIAPPCGQLIPPASSHEPCTCTETQSVHQENLRNRPRSRFSKCGAQTTCACSQSAPRPACAAAGCSPATSGPGLVPAAGSSPETRGGLGEGHEGQVGNAQSLMSCCNST